MRISFDSLCVSTLFCNCFVFLPFILSVILLLSQSFMFLFILLAHDTKKRKQFELHFFNENISERKRTVIIRKRKCTHTYTGIEDAKRKKGKCLHSLGFTYHFYDFLQLYMRWQVLFFRCLKTFYIFAF